jgi:predicted permease
VALAVKRAMARDPADRFATPVELVTAIERAVLASPVGVMTVPGRVAATLIAASRRVVRRKPFSRRRNPLMEQMRQDLRYAVRSLIRQPLFALIVLLTLALAIGLNTAIFSVLHGVLLSPLSYDQPHELVRVGRTRPELPGVLLPISPANFRDIRPQITTLSALEAEAGRSLILADETGATSISGAAVSAGMFDLLAVPPRWGRTFQPGDDDPNAERVVVVSDEFWRTYLGADSTVVGTTIRLSDANFTIIGVMPRRFTFGGRQLWIPLRFTEDDFAGRSTNYLRLYGRLGATTQSQAITELDAQWRRLGEQYAESYDLSGMSTMPLLDAFVERSVRPLRVLGVAVLFVLMIACANVANLMLARTERRSREIAVRAALGAGRGRLARQFLTETVIVSLLGGAIGVGLAFGGVQLLLATFADAVPRAEAVSVNMPVLTFSLVISLVTGLIVGLAPALLAQGDVADLKDGERGGSGRTTPLRQALVVGEIAIALMLVIGAGLMLQEFLARAPVRPGIRSGSSRRRQSLVPAHDVRWRRTARPVHRESHGASRGHS